MVKRQEVRRGWNKNPRAATPAEVVRGGGRIFFINQSSDQRRHARNARARTAALIGVELRPAECRHVETDRVQRLYALGQPRTTGLGGVGSEPPWRTPDLPAGGMQNSRRNGESGFPVFVADPRSRRRRRAVRQVPVRRGGGVGAETVLPDRHLRHEDPEETSDAPAMSP